MRVSLCCAALGGAIGVCLAFLAENISERYERVLIAEEMDAEIAAQVQHHGNNPQDPLPRTEWKSVYIDRPGQPVTTPPALLALAPGLHELPGEGDRFAGIRQTPIGRVTIVAGLPDSPQRERRFVEELTAMILLGIGLGALLGRILAGSMLAPVLRLSDQVEHADPTTALRGIAEDHHADEVGALANAFIRYQRRVQAAIEREVLFSADAGHELRTPLTVLQGALDLLRDSQGSNALGKRRVERIRRSAAEIGTLIDALLLVARPGEDEGPPVDVEIAPVLASAIAECRDELDGAQIAIGLRCAPGASVRATPDLPRVALRLLMRTIATGSWGHELRLDADGEGFVLSSAVMPVDSASRTGEAAAAADANAGEAGTTAASLEAATAATVTQRSDEIAGLGMLRRLCERYGWTLAIAPPSAAPVLLTLRLPRPSS